MSYPDVYDLLKRLKEKQYPNGQKKIYINSGGIAEITKRAIECAREPAGYLEIICYR